MKNSLTTPVLSFAACVALFWVLTGSFLFAFTFLGLLMVHEMGHYFAAQMIGLSVSPPVFTPLGAFINMREMPDNAHDEAFMAFGGPALGTFGTFATLYLGIVFQSPAVIQASYFGFILNLFNLIPWSPLDGGRISQPVSRHLWVIGAPLLGYLVLAMNTSLMNILVLSLILFMGLQDIGARNRLAADNPAYYQVGISRRIMWAALYAALAGTLYLCVANFQHLVVYLLRALS